MAKGLWVEDEEQYDKSHAGCISGMFHVLDYHHWHSNVKKILPHRKHGGFIKHIKGNRRYQRMLDYQDPFDVLEHDQDFVPSPKLQRTYSIHHSESNEWVNPVTIFPETVTKCSASPKPPHSNLTHLETKDSQDSVDTDQFQDSVTRPKLTKSGSFPNAYKSVGKSLIPMKLQDKVNEIYTVAKAERTKNSSGDLESKDVIRFRRISSLHDSADRYTQLFDLSVGKEAALRSSRSLKLTNRSENILNPNQDFESLNEVINKSNQLKENEDLREAESSKFVKDSYELKTEEDNYRISQEITQEGPVLAPEYGPPDEEAQISEGLGVISNSNENLNKKHMNLSIKDDDFTYVKKILQQSGFLTNGLQQKWYSSNQPLDPFVFEELESQYYHDSEHFADELDDISHRLLMFDLVDDVLLTMYERSATYYPKKLSSFGYIYPAPDGSRVLDEVWKRVSRLINLKHDTNETLDDIVSRDLGGGDGWMNLQKDLEVVGVDLEDLIFDEVLEELLLEFI